METESKRDLIFTIAFDAPNAPFHQMMAKMLVSSIFRTGFGGDVLILTNSEHRVFEHGRANVEEISLDTSAISRNELGGEAQQFKYRAREFVAAERYEKVMFVDCDCLFQRSPDELLNGDEDIRFSEEPVAQLTGEYNNAYLTDAELETLAGPCINSGVWWVRGDRFAGVMERWERIDSSPPLRRKLAGDQPAWARLILDAQFQSSPFRLGTDIRYPLIERRTEREFAEAVLLHFNAAKPTEKLAQMFGTYMRRFHAETCFSLLGFLDG